MQKMLERGIEMKSTVKPCNTCKFDGGQYAYGSECEDCKWNYTFADAYEPIEESEGEE